METSLSREQRDDLQNRVVSLLLELRKQYLSAGGSALKNWEHLEHALFIAGRTAASPEEWFSRMHDLLMGKAGGSAPGSSASSEYAALLDYVGSLGRLGEIEFLRLVYDARPALLARARALADAVREAREEAAAEAAPPSRKKRSAR